MKGLLLILVFGCAIISYAAFTAHDTNVALQGYNWATKFCSSARGLCDHPHEMAYGAVGCAVVWLLMMIMK